MEIQREKHQLSKKTGGRNMRYLIVGIDPGVNGGIACISSDDKKIISVHSLTKKTESEIAGIFYSINARAYHNRTPVKCYIEKVGYIKGDGGKGAFTFGKVYGFLRGIATYLKWPIGNVYPAIWQSRLNCLSGGNKNVTKRKAIELYPNSGVKVTHAIADSMLIAYYGSLVHEFDDTFYDL